MTNPNYPEPPRPRSAVSQPSAPVYHYTRQFLQEAQAGVRQATWGPRFVALFIDFMLVAIPFNVLGNLFWLQRTVGSTENIPEVTGVTWGITPPLHNLLWWLAFGLYATLTTLLTGGTVGKRIMNLKVVRADGSKLPAPLVLLRYTIGYGISGLILGLGFALALIDRQSQTLHDKIVKSRVILADPTKI